MAATYEQVIEALRRADAAGNVEDAKQLALMALQLRPSSAATAVLQPRPATGMGEFLAESARRGVTRTPAALTAGSAAATGTFAGSFPAEPELEQVTTENVQRLFGVRPEIRPATVAQRGFGAFIEGLTDPASLVGARGLLGLGIQAIAGGTASAAGEFGGEVGGQVAGLPGQIFGGITAALLSGAGAMKAGESVVRRMQGVKDLDVADLANVEGLSRAKDLIGKAIEADPNLMARINAINDRVKFVTGKDQPAAVTGLDSAALRTKLENIAKTDLKFRAELQSLYADLQAATRAKAAELFPAPGVEMPSATAKAQQATTDFNRRIEAINNQLKNLTTNINLSGDVTPVALGTSIQNLVVAREKAARAALSPEYTSVLKQASDQGALLPAQQTQDLLNTAFDLFQKDPWARQSGLLQLVEQQSNKFKALRRSVEGSETGTTLPATTVPDLRVGLDITSLDSLKRRVADDIRRIKDPTRLDNLRVLQQRVDEALDQVTNSSGAINVNLRGTQTTFGDAMAQLDRDYYNKVGIPFRDAEAIQRINSQEYSEKIAPQIASSPTALTQFLRVAGDEGVPLAERAVMSRLYNQALGKDGLIDPVKLENLLSKNSINGGYSDIVANLPGLQQRLQDVATRSQVLGAEKVAIDDAARAEQARIGQSFLRDYDAGGVDAVISKMLGSTGRGYRNRFFTDLNKISADEKVNVQMAVRSQLVNTMLDSRDPFGFLEKNKDAFNQVFGKAHTDNLAALADSARLAGKIDVNQLPVRDAAVAETSAIQRFIGGVAPERVSNLLVNGIYSNLQKGYRILGLLGQAQVDEATRQAHVRLFMDPAGVKAINEATMRLVTKDGKEVDLRKSFDPKDLAKLANSFGLNVVRTGYVGGATAISPSGTMEQQTEPYFIYEGQ